MVVIGIIALLIALLLPSLTRARAQAHTVQCMSNLRQLGQAETMYVSESGGFIVPAGYRGANDPANPANPETTENWASIFVYLKYVQVPNIASPGQPPTGYSVLRCPDGQESAAYPSTDSAFQNMPTTTTDGTGSMPWRVPTLCTSSNLLYRTQHYVDTWYAINAVTFTATVPGGRNDWDKIPCRRTPSDDTDDSRLRKMRAIHKASEVVFLFDGLFMNAATIRAERIVARHGQGTQTNVLFFDGHAETFLRKSMPQTKDDFANAASLSKYPRPKWRLDQ